MKRKQFTTTLATGLCVAGLSGPAAAIDGPVFTGIGDLPGDVFWSNADAVSGDGNTVVGWSNSDAGTEAILWNWDEGIAGLGDLPGASYHSVARGVSEDGSVIVGHSSSAFKTGEGFSYNGQEAFRWTKEEGMVGLGDLPDDPFSSRAHDVSADGMVIVGTGNYTEQSAFGTSEAFLWTEETLMVGMGDMLEGTINSTANGVSAAGTVIVGFSGATTREAFRWSDSTGMIGLGDLEGGLSLSVAMAVSADGVTVVGQATSEAGPEAFSWTEETGMVGLGDLPGGLFYSVARGVSSDGAVVVGNGNSDIGWEPFVWTELQGMRRLADVLSDDYGLDLSEWQLLRAWDVSDDGLVMVGAGYNPDGVHEGWVVCLRDECFEEDDDDDHEGKKHRHHDDDDD